ncbi:MAG: HD domain-containing protein [Clostridia bacterium]
MKDKLQQQLDFIIEIDRIKSIVRKSKIFHKNRYENDAEHCWHISVMAMVLAEYANEKMDMLKVLKMLLIHDVVKIQTPDKILYKKTKKDFEEEKAAAKKVMAMLPPPQEEEFFGLWMEFKEKNTPESRFAGAVDGLQPLMQNTIRDGKEWRAYNITYEEVIERNRKISEGSKILWDYIKKEIDHADQYDFSDDMMITE